MSVAFALFGLIAAFGGASPAAGMVSTTAETEAPLRIVAFGTSLTARRGWPDALGPALSRCTGRAVHVDRVALAGSTSEWALTKTAAVKALRPDIVLMEVYMNDAALDRFIGVAESRSHVAAMLGDLRSGLPDARIYLMGMNPVHGLRGWLRWRLPAYVEAHRSAAVEAGAGTIDFGPIWAGMSDDERALAIPDGLHPTPEAATAVMVPALMRELAGRCLPGAGIDGAGPDDTGVKNP